MNAGDYFSLFLPSGFQMGLSHGYYLYNRVQDKGTRLYQTDPKPFELRAFSCTGKPLPELIHTITQELGPDVAEAVGWFVVWAGHSVDHLIMGSVDLDGWLRLGWTPKDPEQLQRMGWPNKLPPNLPDLEDYLACLRHRKPTIELMGPSHAPREPGTHPGLRARVRLSMELTRTLYKRPPIITAPLEEPSQLN